jgi:hypothetical protein
MQKVSILSAILLPSPCCNFLCMILYYLRMYGYMFLKELQEQDFFNVTFSIGVSAFMFYYPQFLTLEFPIHVRGFTEVSSETYGI